jgi:hypothetical protein
MNMKVGHARFDSYSKPISSLEIVGEPMADKFKKDYPPKVVNAAEYKLGDLKQKDQPAPVVESTEATITIPKHTAKDKELVDLVVSGEKYKVPRWMVKYISGPC